MENMWLAGDGEIEDGDHDYNADPMTVVQVLDAVSRFDVEGQIDVLVEAIETVGKRAVDEGEAAGFSVEVSLSHGG